VACGLEVSGDIRPDGDMDVRFSDDFVVPQCPNCEGLLKPAVIFFGEFVPPTLFEQAAALVNRSEALVVAGVLPGREHRDALGCSCAKKKLPIVVINRGVTKADRIASVRIDAGASETLEELVPRLRP